MPAPTIQRDCPDMQVCEESGTDLAQTILKAKKKSQKAAEKRTNTLSANTISGAPQCSICKDAVVSMMISFA